MTASSSHEYVLGHSDFGTWKAFLGISHVCPASSPTLSYSALVLSPRFQRLLFASAIFYTPLSSPSIPKTKDVQTSSIPLVTPVFQFNMNADDDAPSFDTNTAPAFH